MSGFSRRDPTDCIYAAREPDMGAVTERRTSFMSGSAMVFSGVSLLAGVVRGPDRGAAEDATHVGATVGWSGVARVRVWTGGVPQRGAHRPWWEQTGPQVGARASHGVAHVGVMGACDSCNHHPCHC